MNTVGFFPLRSLAIEAEAEIDAASSLGLHVRHLNRPKNTSEQARLAKLARGVSGLVAWTDPDVEHAAALSAALDLPGLRPAQAACVRDKARCRECLEDTGLNPRWEKVERGSEVSKVSEACQRVGFPCLLKPAGASGGRGITRVERLENVPDAFQRFLSATSVEKDPVFCHYSDHFIVEEYVLGTEHSVAGVVSEGRISLLAIADKRIDPSNNLEYGIVVPSVLGDAAVAAIESAAGLAVDALGLQDCGFHIDLRVAVGGRVKVLEVGGRLGGQTINSHLIPMSSGGQVLPYELMIKACCGLGLPELMPPSDYTRRAVARFVYPSRKGILAETKGLERIRDDKFCESIVPLAKTGDLLYPPKEKYNRFFVALTLWSAPLSYEIDRHVDEVIQDHVLVLLD